MLQEIPADDKEVTNAENKTSIAVYLAAFFIVIASVLGTGILGIPVKLDQSGFWPFLVTYSVCFIMQSLIIFFMAEVLQRAKILMQDYEDAIPMLPTNPTHSEDAIAPTQRTRTSTPIVSVNNLNSIAATNIRQELDPNISPDLHALGKLFLGRFSRRIFDFAVMLHFISILISYALAGSQAYAQLFGIPDEYLIFPFVFLLTLLIILGSAFIQTIISVMTFAKGSVLVLVVLVTMIVGNQARLPISNNWLFTGKSFLIGTVALGGAVNVLPVVFARVVMSKSDMRKFLQACIAGLFFVWLLNIIWCYFLLRTVPQTGGGITLEWAASKGKIATVPLIEIINDKYPNFKWIAFLVDIFIMVSITVSFVTMGTGLKHGFLIIIEYVTSLALNMESGIFICFMLGRGREPKYGSLDVPLSNNNVIFKLRYMVMFYFVFAVLYDILTAGMSLFQ